MKRSMIAAAAAGLVLAAVAPVHAERIYGMTAAASTSLSPGLGLVFFDSATPGAVTTIGAFSGVVAGQAVRSMDFRPATGQLYAISTGTTAATYATAQLYTVNLTTAALTAVGSGFTLTNSADPRVEMDFNPVVDRIRVVTVGAAANNFRVNPINGTLVQPDTDLAYAATDQLAGESPFIVAAAYSNNVAGATTTTLYAYDYSFDALVTIGGPNGTPSPNGGQLFSNNLPADFLTFNGGIGMDVSGVTGTLYITHDDPNNVTPMSLYRLNPATGDETLVGAYGGGIFVTDISVVTAPVPEPATWALGLVGAAGLLLRRRLAR